MFDERVRQQIAPWLRRPAAVLGQLGVSPNQLTVVAFLLAGAAATLVATGWVWVGMAVWLASRLLDALDGLVARGHGRATAFGGFLDITLDMAAYSLMIVGFAIQHPDPNLAWLLILVGYVLCITTTAVLSSSLEQRRATVAGNDRSLQFTPGLAEAGETTIAYLLFALLPAWVAPLAWIWAAVLMYTAAQRTLLASRLLRD